MKKILLFIISITLILILCSCGGEKDYKHLEFYPQDDGRYHVGLADSVNRENITDLDDIEIPMLYKGRLVDGIAAYGFAGCKNLTELDLPLHVIEIGEGAFGECGFESLTIPMHVKKVGANAFTYCRSLTSVEFKGIITEIDHAAFIFCAALTDVKLPVGLRTIDNSTFLGCTALEEIEIPVGVRIIGNSAFARCESLKGVDLPRGLIEIDANAFTGCAAITEITIPDGVVFVGKDAFKDCTALTRAHFGGPEIITMNTVGSMRELTSVSFGEGVKEIQNLSFTNAKKLKSVTLPNGIRSIDMAFNAQSSIDFNSYGSGLYLGNEENPYIYLISSNGIAELNIHPDTKVVNSAALIQSASYGKITLPDGIRSVSGTTLSDTVNGLFTEYKGGYYLGTEDNPYHLMYGTVYGADDSVEIHPDTVIISTNAFSTWHNLSHLHIPAKVSSIIPIIARYGNKLTEITVDPDNKHFEAVDGVLYSADGRTLICYPRMKEGDSFDIPSGVKTIAPYAFCSSQITEITVGGDVREIGNYAFIGCEGLEKFTLSKSVSFVGAEILPNTVKRIAFQGNEREFKRITVLLSNYYLSPEHIIFE